jgi:hypothetical protein
MATYGAQVFVKGHGPRWITIEARDQQDALDKLVALYGEGTVTKVQRV